jgi:HlyD family secretion protein
VPLTPALKNHFPTRSTAILPKLRRLVFWIIGFALVAIAVFFAVRPRPVLVDIATATVGPMDVRIEEDGRTRIRERYVVSTPLTGRLLRITFDVGDSVSAAETIVARMQATDSTLLDPRAVAQAKARVRAAERKLEASKSDLTKVTAEMTFAETEMGRLRQLRARNAASDLEFAQKELMFRQETEEVRSAGFAVDIAEYELELERAALMLTDPEQRDNDEMELSIKAPIDGRILRIYQESTAVVIAGSPLMEVGDPSDLEVVADVLSRDAVRISADDQVTLKHWGGDGPLQGRVRLTEPSGFTKLSALGVEEQRVNVIIDLSDPPESRKELGDGFRVDCEVIVWEASDALQIPTSSLFRVDEDWHVFVVDGSEARLTPVKIDHNNGRTAEVLEGINAGTQVITHPSDTIENGVTVAKR